MFWYSFLPLRNFAEEVKQIMQTGGVSSWQQTGQQLKGGHPVLQIGQCLGFKESCLELRGEKGLWKLPAKLFDECSNIIGQCCGKTTLSQI